MSRSPSAPLAESRTTAPTETTRRHLSTRQAATVERLALAAIDELRDHGYAGLTVRNVAGRAEVAPATAYTYFTSKEHLVTEVFWRKLRSLPESTWADSATRLERVVETLSDFALLVADEPAVAAACSVAMLAPEPDVRLLRDRIGAEWRRRLVAALGEGADPAVLTTLELSVSGALIHAGMGHLEYRDLPERLAAVARLVVGSGR